MRHRRSDYEAIQPWPTKRPHIAKQNGNTVNVPDEDEGWAGIDALAQMAAGRVQPIIPDDEPVFLIRAQDAVGPDAVRAWADLAEAAGARPDLIEAVRGWADEMATYATEHGSHVPNAPAESLER